MNVFVLDINPTKLAEYHNDKHIVKMVLETAQLLSSVHHMLDSPLKDECYRLTHKNHPWAVWARANAFNYQWLFQVFGALAGEYTFRYGRVHKSWDTKKDILVHIPMGFHQTDEMTSMPLCMPDYCIKDNVIDSYRNYYMTEKAHIAKWTKRQPPSWYQSF